MGTLCAQNKNLRSWIAQGKERIVASEIEELLDMQQSRNSYQIRLEIKLYKDRRMFRNRVETVISLLGILLPFFDLKYNKMNKATLLISYKQVSSLFALSVNCDDHILALFRQYFCSLFLTVQLLKTV